MKNLLLIFSLLLGTVTATGQPVLTSANFSPKQGDVCVFYACDSTLINPGSAGANQVWDFSAITLSGGWNDTIMYYPVGIKQSIADTFPNGDVVGINRFSYYNRDYLVYADRSDTLKKLGFCPNCYTIPPLRYDTPVLAMVYPFTYNSSFFTGGIYVSNPTMIRAQWDTIVCDGFGKLVLPYATFDSVLRIHLRGVYFDTISNDPYSRSNRVTIDSFAWVAPRVHGPLFTISTRHAAIHVDGFRDTVLTFKTVSMSYYYHQALKSVFLHKDLHSLNIVPNPVHSKFQVIFDLIPPPDFRFQLYDAAGTPVPSTTIHSERGDIDISPLPNGIYFMQVTDTETGEKVMRKIIKE